MQWLLLVGGEYRHLFCALCCIFFFGFFFNILYPCRYGGTLLGPARFSHIETCATEVCKAYKKSEELEDYITTLRTLDDLLIAHREHLASLTVVENDETNASVAPNVSHSHEPSSTPTQKKEVKKADYRGLDVTKAKRLIQARENSIKSVKAVIAKKSNPD